MKCHCSSTSMARSHLPIPLICCLKSSQIPAGKQIEEDWKAGRIGSRECLVRQIDLVRATPSQFDTFVAGIEIDPGFPGLRRPLPGRGTRHYRRFGWSGSCRQFRILARTGIKLPHFANHLEWLGADRWRLAFPLCPQRLPGFVGQLQMPASPRPPSARRESWSATDGPIFALRSGADLVFAKAALARHCRATITILPISIVRWRRRTS